jgi:hypothetical protein
VDLLGLDLIDGIDKTHGCADMCRESRRTHELASIAVLGLHWPEIACLHFLSLRELC